MYGHFRPPFFGGYYPYYPHYSPYPFLNEFEEGEHEYGFGENEIRNKRDDIEINEDMVRGNIQPQSSMKPVPQPINSITQVHSEINVLNVLKVIEIETPDILNTLIALGLTMEAARQLIIKVIKMTHKCSK